MSQPWPTTAYRAQETDVGIVGALPLLGRILLSGIFLASGVMKFADWEGTAGSMASQDIPLIPLLLPIAAVVEIVGGLMVLTGCFSRLGALALFLFLIPTTGIFHDFWTFQGAEQQNQMQHFMKNVTIMGGLLLVMGLGAGPLSIDAWRRTDRSGTARK
jgi:putative oxidoreductase